MLRAKLAAIFLSLMALAGCTTNPVTGESQFTIVSPQQEVAMGSKQFGPSQQSQGGLYLVDPELSVYVNQVGQKLAAKSDRPNLPYEFVVLNNDVPNAWALPGGKIALNRGLLIQLEDEAQLAAVLAHEVVHAAARHSAQQMTQSVLWGVGTQIAAVAGSRSEYGALVGTGAQMGAAMYQAKYGRDQELEADRYGMLYMARAGYDPDAAVELQQTFVRLAESQQSNWLAGLFASHPPSQARVEANREHAAGLTGSTRNKQAFQRAIAQIVKNKDAYAKHQQAIAAANDGKFDEAKSLVKQAMKLQPRESLFPTTMGQLEMQAKEYKSAISYFDQANKIYPEYYMPLLGRGLAAKQLQSYTRAEQDLIASSKLLPTQLAVFHLGEIKLAQGNKQEAITYFQQASQGGGELAEKSMGYLNQLVPQPAASGAG